VKNPRKKFKRLKVEFLSDLSKIMDNATAMSIYMTYIAYRHRKHIHGIWSLSLNHRDSNFFAEYRKTLMRKVLCCKEEFYSTLLLINKDFSKKYERLIPERLALGWGYAYALSYLLRQNKGGIV
jgi:hypothetical protein